MGSVGPPNVQDGVCSRVYSLWRGAYVGDWLRSGVWSDALHLLLLRRNDGSVTAGREKTKRITVDLPKSEHKFLRDFAYDNDTDGMRFVREGPAPRTEGRPEPIAPRARLDTGAMSPGEDWSLRAERWRIPWEKDFRSSPDSSWIVRGSIDAQAERVCSM